MAGSTISPGPQAGGAAEPKGASAAGPIGIFDSGVGGLSVMREIRRLLPGEELVYVADSRYCPYGEKSEAEIRARALTLTRFLVERGAKCVVVACNTASVAALDALRASFAVPIVGMEPGVKPAASATRTGVVGVLATGATLGGQRFARLVERFAEGVQVLTQPCPGLVQQVERGELDALETEELIRGYLRALLDRGADAVVLGCTHYPFLRETIARIAGPDVTLIDTGPAVARQLKRVLREHWLLRRDAATGGEQFYTSGDPDEVAPVVERLWGLPACVHRHEAAEAGTV